MSHLKSVIRVGFFAVSFLLATSCVKDVDLEQAQDITLNPDIDVDLVQYQLNENDFIDSETGEFTSVIRDTVRLEFLNDTYVQDALQYAEFRFRHENTFPYSISSKIRFLSDNGREQFSVNYEIPPGAENVPGIIDTLHVVGSGDIKKVRRSIQMALELQLNGRDSKIKGGLDFLSKGLFKFEF